MAARVPLLMNRKKAVSKEQLLSVTLIDSNYKSANRWGFYCIKMENMKENKLNTIKMELFQVNIFIKMENKKENKLITMKMEIFKWNHILKMDMKKENKLDTMKMEILNFNIIIKMEIY